MAIILVKVVLVFRAIPCELTTSYTGYNQKILNSVNELTHQNVDLLKRLYINGGKTMRVCFDFKLLNRTFLMVLDQERLYEVIEVREEGKEKADKIYVRLTESWFYILRTYDEDDKIVYKITLTLAYEYSPEAFYYENFKVQFKAKKDNEVVKLLETIRPREED